MSEIVRVARSGARIAVVEPDYGTLAIKGADPEITDKIRQCRRERFRAPTIGRHLPKLFKELGMANIVPALLTIGSIDIAQEEERAIVRKYAFQAHAAGMVSDTEATAWLADLDSAGRSGTYSRTLAVFLVSGCKP